MMMEPDAIVFDKVSKTYTNNLKPAVCETSLKVKKGVFVTVVGASGCGKTTLLTMINRIQEPSTGHIMIQGKDIKTMPKTCLRRQIGYVIQQIGLFPHMTVEKNIAIVPEILGWDKQKKDRRIDFLLELVALPPKEFRKRYPRQLSGGQQQRVGLARAMAGDPEIMLMDEPFGAIDAITRLSLQDELLCIQKKLHKTILFVTHDIDEALKLGDKIIIMNEGKVLQYDTPLNMILSPANDFVRNLVNSEDVIQRLSLMKAEQAMIGIEGKIDARELRVSSQENLKNVLICILRSERDSVIVEDDSEKPVGRIWLNQLKMNKVEEMALAL